MKTTTIKTFALLAVTIGLSNIVNAQTENTSERLITQLKNGTAPGLLFSNERTTAPVLNKKLNEKEGLITQIRKGTATGMQFKQGGGESAPVAARMATAVPTQPLASEQKPVTEKATAAPAVLPKQE